MGLLVIGVFLLVVGSLSLWALCKMAALCDDEEGVR